MLLPRTANCLKPLVFGGLEEDAASNGSYRGLESREKSFRSQPDDRAAYRASVSFEPDSLGKSIKIRQHMAMSPDL